MRDSSNAPDLAERMRLVVELTDINSRHLLGEGRRGGARFELERACEDLVREGSRPDLEERIAVLRQRLRDAEGELLALEQRRAQLAWALAQWDDAQAAAHAAAADKQGRTL